MSSAKPPKTYTFCRGVNGNQVLSFLVFAHGVFHDPVEFFVFWTFIPAFMHHGSGAGGEGGWVGGV